VLSEGDAVEREKGLTAVGDVAGVGFAVGGWPADSEDVVEVHWA